jgi:hypothetical protein
VKGKKRRKSKSNEKLAVPYTLEDLVIHFTKKTSAFLLRFCIQPVISMVSHLLLLLVYVNCYKFRHSLQLRAHSCSVRLMSTTHFQLLRTQGHVFFYSDTPLLGVKRHVQKCVAEITLQGRTAET